MEPGSLGRYRQRGSRRQGGEAEAKPASKEKVVRTTSSFRRLPRSPSCVLSRAGPPGQGPPPQNEQERQRSCQSLPSHGFDDGLLAQRTRTGARRRTHADLDGRRAEQVDWIPRTLEIDFGALFARDDCVLLGRTSWGAERKQGGGGCRHESYVLSTTTPAGDCPGVTLVVDLRATVQGAESGANCGSPPPRHGEELGDGDWEYAGAGRGCSACPGLPSSGSRRGPGDPCPPRGRAPAGWRATGSITRCSTYGPRSSTRTTTPAAGGDVRHATRQSRTAATGAPQPWRARSVTSPSPELPAVETGAVRRRDPLLSGQGRRGRGCHRVGYDERWGRRLRARSRLSASSHSPQLTMWTPGPRKPPVRNTHCGERSPLTRPAVVSLAIPHLLQE